VAAPFPLSDAGNAERFAAGYSISYRFVHGWNRWHRWDSRRWSPDLIKEVVQDAIVSARYIGREAEGLADAAERKKAILHALASERSRAIEDMLRLASSNRDLAVRPEDLDANPWLLNVNNGTIDLKTGCLRPHNRDDLITRLAPSTFDPGAPCPTWDAFLDKVTAGNLRLQAFIQRAVGYSISGDVSEHALFLLYGRGANGKSTLLETLLAVLGDYAKAAAPGLLMYAREGRHEEQVAELQGVRLATGHESGVDQTLDEPRLKYLTGGDTISARRLYAERIEFPPSHKLWIGTNHKPRVRGGDEGIWRRLKLIPFTAVISEQERDPHLKEKLLAEAPGILSWAVHGCLGWQREGLGVPEEVREATASYRAAEDSLEPFLEECCVRAKGATVSSSALFDAYRKWTEVDGTKTMSQQALAEALEARGIEKRRTKLARIWIGLRLRAASDDAGDGRGLLSDNPSTRAREERLS